MFNTGFQTLDQTRHRRQTTKGIWCAKDPSSNLLVLDIEGSDSRERWEGKTVMYDYHSNSREVLPYLGLSSQTF